MEVESWAGETSELEVEGEESESFLLLTMPRNTTCFSMFESVVGLL